MTHAQTWASYSAVYQLCSLSLLLPFQPKLVLIYRPRRDGRLSWPCVTDWFHTEINVRHREVNPDVHSWALSRISPE